MQVIANLSMLFTELPLLERIGAAKQAGFAGVEIQFPYEVSALELKRVLDEQHMPLHLINLPAGDLMQGGLGLACQVKRRTEFAEALDTALEYAAIAKPKMVNVLAGRLKQGANWSEAFSLLASNVRNTARAFSRQHTLVVCEAINPMDMPGFLINTPKHLQLLLKEVGRANCFAQLDLYHLARQQIDVLAAIDTLAGQIAHVQFADCPGRHEPGTGLLDFLTIKIKLIATGYRGAWAAEYIPSSTTSASLAWLNTAAFSGVNE